MRILEKLSVRIAETLGYRLVRNPLATHVAKLLRRLRINCVLDVGANTGQYARSLREAGYEGRIVSFEPIPEIFEALERASARDRSWQVRRLALGDEDGRREMFRSRNSLLSSFFAPSPQGREVDERIDAERSEIVEIRRLDGLFDELVADLPGPRVFLKLDTQGYDLRVIRGASGVIDDIVGLQSELSVVPIYEGMPDYVEALETYRASGFEVTGFFPVFHMHRSKILGEFDCVMVRDEGLLRRHRSPRPESDPAVTALVASTGPSPALERCLAALDREVRTLRAELVVVLNCARSSLPEGVVAALAARVDQLLFEPRIGKPHALNTGILHCRGEVIAFTDDDTEAQAGWLSAITESLLAPDRPDDLAGCGGRVVPLYPSSSVPDWYEGLVGGRTSHFLGPRHDLGDHVQEYDVPPSKLSPVPFSANCAFRREVFERHRYDPDLGPNRSSALRGGADTLLAMELLGEARMLVYRPDAVVHHPVGPAQVSPVFVLRAYFIAGVETVRVMRALGRRPFAPGQLRRDLARRRIVLLMSGTLSGAHLMKSAARYEYRRGMLAELDGSFRRGAAVPQLSSVALRAVHRLDDARRSSPPEAGIL